MQSHTIFNKNPLCEFTRAINGYCDKVNYHDLQITDNELTQLSWYMGSDVVTPEASASDIQDKLHFEIKRGLARLYSFELLLRGDKEAYLEFVQGQDESNTLPYEVFKQLSDQAKRLDADVKVAVRASCILTIVRDRLPALREQSRFDFSGDSEEFLSQLGNLLPEQKSLLPLTADMTEKQLSFFAKMYWPNMHLRNMLFTEGGDSMTDTFSQGVNGGSFGQADFELWKWRWLTNLFGFQGGPAANYYTAETHILVESVLMELQTILKSPEYSYLDNYLLERAQMAGLVDDLTENELQFLGHVAANCHRVHVITSEHGQSLLAGYQAYKRENGDADLASLYLERRKDKDTVTPTYVPAIINNAFVAFRDTIGMNEGQALQHATQFMCQFLQQLYLQPRHERISCMKLARNTNMPNLLTQWMKDHASVQFKLQEGEFILGQKSSLGFSVRM